MSAIPQIDGQISFNESQLEDIENFCIPVHYSNRCEEKVKVHRMSNQNNLVTIKRSNKLVEASNLPIVLALNPRSLYNKSNEFISLIDQTEAGLCFVSETWDRSHLPKGLELTELIDIEGYKWVQNVVQRKRKGGKPAILISDRHYHVAEICPDPITVPLDVEIAWALLTPKKRFSPNINHIVAASFYYSSKFTKKSILIDHISETFHFLCAKYGPDTKFIISGDANRLNLKPILNLSPDLKQVVTIPTRRNPDATLDVIITNLSSLYQPP